MPTFDTPEPITAEIDVAAGDIHVVAGDRTDTVVRVEPGDPSHDPDVRAAGNTKVEFAGGRLLVKGPSSRAVGLFGKIGTIDVTVELPAGSQLRGAVAAGTFRGSGRLGECRIKTSAGNIELDETGPLTLHTGAGSVDVGHVAGQVDISTGSGGVRVRAADGPGVIKNSNGLTWVGEVGGDLNVKSSNGTITVDRAGGGVLAHTAYGEVRVGDVVRGTVSLSTAFGGIEVGIHEGTAAHLDVSTKFGHVRNDMAGADQPAATEETVDVQARTSFGDITIRRA